MSVTTDGNNHEAANQLQLSDELFDVAQFNEMRSLADEQFAGLLRRFCDDTVVQIENMRTAAINKDADLLRQYAHKLKGAASTLGATALSDSCHRMEEKARGGQMHDALETVETIARRFAEVAAVIQPLLAAP